MTLQQAIMDKDRPLSMTPQQWMQYQQAKQYQDDQLIENEVKTIIEQDETTPIEVLPQEKLDIGIQQMVIGCRIAMKMLQQLDRTNVSPKQREVYNEIKDLVNNAIAPYLADILKSRKKLYK